jgi:hypothetical protein
MANPGVHVAHVAAAAAKRAHDNVVKHLREHHALQPSAAVPLDGFKGADRQAFHRLVKAGVIRDAGGNRHYLDEGRLRAHAERQKQNARMAGLIALVVVLVVLAAVAVSLAMR